MTTAFRLGFALSTCLGLSCAALAQEPGQAAEIPLVAAKLQTAASASGKVEAGAFAIDPARSGDSRIVGSAALGGLESYSLDGKRRAAIPAGEASAVAAIADGGATLLAAIDATGNRLRLFRSRGARIEEAGAREIALGFAGEGVCLYRHAADDSLHAFVVGDGGEIDQFVLFANADGKFDARPVRRIHLPSTVKQCAADARGHVYAAEEATAVWRFNADPETDLKATIVDAPRLGRLEKETKGVAAYDGGEGRRWLFVADADAGRINVHDRERKDAFLGAFRAGAGGKAIAEPGPLAATAAALPSAPHGALLVVDEDAANYKLLSIDDIAAALKLPAPAAASAPAAGKRFATVVAVAETRPMDSYGDAADDPAIRAHPDDPAKSLVIGTDKRAGLYVYDMQGKVKHFIASGKMNNVDLREGFELGGSRIVLVAASNRTDKSIGLYRLDTATGELVDVADGVQPTGLGDPYGLCLYRSARDGRTYVFVNGDDTRFRQWQLVATGNGKVKAKLLRELAFDSQTEGCVADDETGALYVDEEDVALWKLSAEPDGGDARTAIARVAGNPALKDDLEGLGIYDLGGGRGYIVVSSQGNDSYAVFRREGGHEYLGSFAVVADPASGIDGISETDGLEISSRNLGPGLENGAMVAQDGRNVMPVENQNFKIVPWKAIAEALGLEMRQP